MFCALERLYNTQSNGENWEWAYLLECSYEGWSKTLRSLLCKKEMQFAVHATPFPALPNRAHDNFEKIKGVYGAGSCYLLQVNSRAPGTPSQGTPDPWSQFSISGSAADHEVVSGWG